MKYVNACLFFLEIMGCIVGSVLLIQHFKPKNEFVEFGLYIAAAAIIGVVFSYFLNSARKERLRLEGKDEREDSLF